MTGPLILRGAWLFAELPDLPSAAEPARDAREDADAALDAGLVTATLGGDDGAFAELIRRHKGRVFGMATRFSRDAHEREDLCQEIFVHAYRKLRDFRGESPFDHWLGRLAVRKCYDLLRRTGRERKTHVALDGNDALPAVVDPTTGQDRNAREAGEILARAMAALPADDRLVLTLLELEDLPVREVSSLTGWSETNVRTRAYRARAALKKNAVGARYEIPMKTPSPSDESPVHDATLDALFATARMNRPDTSRAEYEFETRLLARLASEKAEPDGWTEFFAWCWRLAPGFAVVTLAAGFWTWWPAASLPDDESVFVTSQPLPADDEAHVAQWLAVEWLNPI